MASSRWRRRRPRHRLAREEGSILLLVPAAVLVLVALVAIAVDAAVVYLGQRRLADLAAGLANDAVAAVDEAAFYERGDIELVVERIDRRRDAVLSALDGDASLHEVACGVSLAPEAVTVACTGRAEPIFGRALPGARGFYDLRATAAARAAQG